MHLGTLGDLACDLGLEMMPDRDPPPKGGGGPASCLRVALSLEQPCAPAPPSLSSPLAVQRPPSAQPGCLPAWWARAPGPAPSPCLSQQKGLEAASCSLNVLGSDSLQEGDALSKRNLGTGCFQGRNLCEAPAKVWQHAGYNSKEGGTGLALGPSRVGDGEDPRGLSLSNQGGIGSQGLGSAAAGRKRDVPLCSAACERAEMAAGVQTEGGAWKKVSCRPPAHPRSRFPGKQAEAISFPQNNSLLASGAGSWRRAFHREPTGRQAQRLTVKWIWQPPMM